MYNFTPIFMPFPLIPVLTAATAIVGSLLSNRAAKKQQQAQNRFNKSENELAYRRELEKYNMVNAYNTPAAQMQRYGDAGLNPNLIYGQGNSGNASGGPSYSPTSSVGRAYSNPVQFLPEVLGMYQQFQMRNAQIDNVKASAEEKRANILNKGLTSALLRIKGKREEYALGREPDVSGIINNKAQASEAILAQEWQKLKNMKQDEMNKMLTGDTMSLKLSSERLKQESLAADLLFKRYRNEWIKQGVTSSDHPLLRIFVRMLGESGIEDLKGKIQEGAGQLQKEGKRMQNYRAFPSAKPDVYQNNPYGN